MFWEKWLRPRLEPDLELFHNAIINSVYGKTHSGVDVAGDFRSLFNQNPHLGQRVLFMLMTWCGEYEGPPEDDTALQRWAGKREVAGHIKAAMFADLSTPNLNLRQQEIDDNDPKRD
jgi:hypothetical protein